MGIFKFSRNITEGKAVKRMRWDETLLQVRKVTPNVVVKKKEKILNAT